MSYFQIPLINKLAKSFGKRTKGSQRKNRTFNLCITYLIQMDQLLCQESFLFKVERIPALTCLFQKFE